MPRTTRSPLIWVGLITASVAISACKDNTQQAGGMPQMPPAPVTVVKAISQDVPVYLDEIGRAVASESVTIQPQVDGQILKRYFKDGDDIEKGQKLFSIDPRNYEAAVEQATANLEKARADLELAQSDYTRMQKAAAGHAVSQEDVDAKKAALDTATAQVKVMEATLKDANLKLSYCEISSPITGRAGERLVDAGNLVKSNDTKMLTIYKVSPLNVDFTIREQDLPDVRARMAEGTLKGEVTLPQSPNVVHEGNLSFLDNTVQSSAGRIHLWVTLENQDRYFWAGQFVNVRLVLKTIPKAVLVPFGCTQMSQQGPFVYVVKQEKDAAIAEMRPVSLGQRQHGTNGEDLIVLTSGVQEGEPVINAGQLMIIGPGTKVRVVEPTPPAAGVSAKTQSTSAATTAATQSGGAK